MYKKNRNNFLDKSEEPRTKLSLNYVPRYTITRQLPNSNNNADTDMYILNANNKIEINYQRLLSQLLEEKTTGVVFDGFWIILEDTINKIRKTVLPGIDFRKYFTIEAGHVVWIKIERLSNGEFNISSQTITTNYTNPDTNLLYLINTGIQNTKLSDATTGIHGKGNVYSASPYEIIEILKILDNEKNQPREMVPQKYHTLFKLYDDMQIKYIPQIKELVENKKLPLP